MANTYTLIASNTLSSSAASVTFSSIPGTYTDLVLRVSIRGAAAAINDYARLTVNSIATGYSETDLYASGTSASSSRLTTRSNWLYGGGWHSANLGTSNTFSNTEIYIPNYAGSTNKIASRFSAQENNTANNNNIGVEALLLSNTAIISSVTVDGGGVNFVSGSSFFLYGIKNS